jgi:hypothetical protein
MKATPGSVAAVIAGASVVLAGTAPLQPRQSGLPPVEVRGNGERFCITFRSQQSLTKPSFLRG